MQWSRIFSNLKSVQYNEKLYTYLLHKIRDKLLHQKVVYRTLEFDDVHPMDYEEYKLEVFYLVLRIVEHYTSFKGRCNEDVDLLKSRLLNTIMDMHVAYGVLNK